MFETNANHEYIFSYNPEKTLTEQEVSKLAKGMIALLFRDYWATEKQREKIRTKQNQDRQKAEEEKRENYPNTVIFAKQDKKEELALVEVKTEKWYEKSNRIFFANGEGKTIHNQRNFKRVCF